MGAYALEYLKAGDVPLPRRDHIKQKTRQWAGAPPSVRPRKRSRCRSGMLFSCFLTVTSGNCPHILRSLSREGAQHFSRPAVGGRREALGVGHVLAIDPNTVQ